MNFSPSPRTATAKHIELVELANGEVVAVGPFATQDEAQDFAEHIEHGDGLHVVVNGSRGGVRLLTVTALARELGVSTAALKPN